MAKSDKDKAPDPQEDKDKETPAETESDDDGKVTLTKDELAQQIADALKADREKRKKKEKAKQREAEPDDDEEEQEDPEEVIRKAELRAATAEQERDEAKKQALLAQVENKLRDYLALNMRQFIGNAPDIMLHIEKALTANAKEGEIARLIESHAKAFAERSKAVSRPASGAPLGGARSRVGGVTGTDDPDQRRTADRAVAVKAEASTPARWSTINYQG